MTEVEKPCRKKKSDDAKRAKGLERVSVWIPSQASDELKELCAVITEFYLEQGEFHKDLFPTMYRDFKTGVMGNKSLYDIKKAMEKENG